MNEEKINEALSNPETAKKLEGIDKAMETGSDMIIAAVEGMGFKLDDKQKEKIKTIYAMAFLMTGMTM